MKTHSTGVQSRGIEAQRVAVPQIAWYGSTGTTQFGTFEFHAFCALGFADACFRVVASGLSHTKWIHEFRSQRMLPNKGQFQGLR